MVNWQLGARKWIFLVARKTFSSGVEDKFKFFLTLLKINRRPN